VVFGRPCKGALRIFSDVDAAHPGVKQCGTPGDRSEERKLLSSIRHLAQRVRHQPALERYDWLWNAARKPYRALFSVGGCVGVSMGGVTVKMPAEFAAFNWESYEPEAFQEAALWIRDNPNGLILDVGSAVGGFSALALFASETSEVVAFDSDLGSLVAFANMRRGSAYRPCTDLSLTPLPGKTAPWPPPVAKQLASCAKRRCPVILARQNISTSPPRMTRLSRLMR
jgi:hypothetical protein